MGILSYTMEQIVDKASIAIQSTKLFSQAFLQWNVLLFKNKTWSDLKYHFCKGIQILPRHGSGHIGPAWLRKQYYEGKLLQQP